MGYSQLRRSTIRNTRIRILPIRSVPLAAHLECGVISGAGNIPLAKPNITDYTEKYLARELKRSDATCTEVPRKKNIRKKKPHSKARRNGGPKPEPDYTFFAR